ncbi:hypothetical protein IP88_11550 [alpha proteobacterium AAP81b]|nr:hypothetical protein IP88_11550 [alpha proteobacterium AAP81b]
MALAPGAVTAQAASPAVAASPAGEAALRALFAEWRAFLLPPPGDYRSDYGPAAIAARTATLARFRARLAAIDPSGWPLASRHDWHLVEAEMNGLDFELRVLRPWARDPSFHANVFADRSDVPRHEGPSAHPNLDLYDFAWPLRPADQRRLTAALTAVPGNLAAARVTLTDSTAHDLWAYGSAAFREQSATLAALAENRLVMVTLDGRKRADMKGASSALLAAIAKARAATEDFAAWVAAEAPKRTGPSGVGIAEYDWYAKNVARSPYDWAAQRVLLQRELDRSLAALRLEEVRNRALPPLPDLDAQAFAAAVTAKKARFTRFMADAGLIPDAPWAHAAVAAQAIDHVAAPDRNFFAHVNAGDPLPLLSHFTHWIDLERYRSAPHPDPIRATPPPFNSFADRSEGFATAFEEMALHAGLYDDIPHGRELVWIMLANRAARGLASLDVQANRMDLAAAGKFHAGWTPRGWSDAASPLVGFEQLLYLRQPGYGASYINGKLMLDHLIAAASHAEGARFDVRALMARVGDAGIVPPAMVEAEVVR